MKNFKDHQEAALQALQRTNNQTDEFIKKIEILIKGRADNEKIY